jgi:hypothetical protein
VDKINLLRKIGTTGAVLEPSGPPETLRVIGFFLEIIGRAAFSFFQLRLLWTKSVRAGKLF